MEAKRFRLFFLTISALQILECRCEMTGSQKVLELHKAAEEGNDTAIALLLSAGVAADSRLKNGGLTPLYIAAEKGFKSTMEILQRHGAKLNANITVDRNMILDLLSYASRHGNLRAVQSLLEARANFSSVTTCFKFTPLHHAVLSGNVEVVEALIKSGANLNADSTKEDPLVVKKDTSCPDEMFARIYDNSGSAVPEDSIPGSPLAVAARNCNKVIVNLLLNHKADINGRGTNKPPLIAAIMGKCEDIAMKLLADGAHFDSKVGQFSAVHWAALYGLENITKHFVNMGLANVRNANGVTPLHIVKDGATARILIAGGANVNAITDKNETPLHRAAYNERGDVVKVLLENNANMKLLSNETYGVSETLDDYKKFLKLLQKNNARFQRSVAEGFSPMAVAVLGGSENILTLMINKSIASLNPRDSEWPPFHIAAYNGNINMVKFLIGKGADINIPDSFGLTALHKAVMMGKKEMVELLLEMEANLNATDINNWTPLHVAAKYQQIASTKMLINAGSDGGGADSGGFTPLIWAEIGWHPFFLKLMIEKTLDLNSSNRYNYFEKLIKKEKQRIVTWFQPKLKLSEQEQLEEFLDVTLKDVSYNSDYFIDIVVEPIFFDVYEREYKDHSLKPENINTLDKILESLQKPLVDYKQVIEDNMKYYYQEHIEMITLIMDKTADIDKVDNIIGWGALHWASACGDMEVVKLLVERNAYLNPKSVLGHTPMYLARYWGRNDVYNYFKQLGAVW